jgi:hypothetical protein
MGGEIMKRKIRISIPKRTAAWVEKQAAIRGITASAFVAESLREYLGQVRRRRRVSSLRTLRAG